MRSERASERNQLRREREREVERKKQSRQEQINAWVEEVQGAEAYLSGLGRLHTELPSVLEAAERMRSLLMVRECPAPVFVRAPVHEPPVPRVYDVPVLEPVLFKSNALLGAAIGFCFGWGVCFPFFPEGLTAVFVGGVVSGGLAWAVWRFQRAAYAKRESERLVEHEAQVAAEQARVTAENSKRAAAFASRQAVRALTEARRREFWEARAAQNAKQSGSREQERISVLQRANRGEAASIEIILEALLPCCLDLSSPPDEYAVEPYEPGDAQIGYRVTGSAPIMVELVVVAPGAEAVPTRESEMSPGGERIKYKAIPVKRRNEVWRELIESMALAQVAAVLGAAPALAGVDIEVWDDAVDPATGKEESCCLLAGRVRRDVLEVIDLGGTVASAVWTSLGCERGNKVSKGKGHLSRKIPEDALTWARPEAEQGYVPDGLIHGWEPKTLPNEFCRHDPVWELPGRVTASGSIAAALKAVRPGGVVDVPAGLYAERLALRWPVTLLATAPGKVEIASDEGDAVDCRTVGVELNGLTLRATSADADAVYVAQGEVKLTACSLCGRGSGLALYESEAQATDLTLSGSGKHGVYVGRRSTLHLTRSRVDGNEGSGVAAHYEANASLDECVLTRNGQQGVTAFGTGTVVVSRSDLRGNTRGPTHAGDAARVALGEGVLVK